MSEHPDPSPASLQRVTVVVDLAAPADADVAALVAASLPLAELPAMSDDASREDDVRLSSDGTALEVVLLVEATTDAEAMDLAVAATERALRAADLGPDVARPGQVTVLDAYTP